MQKKSATKVPADWHPADIKAELNKKGLTLRALSLANNMHQDSLKTRYECDTQEVNASLLQHLVMNLNKFGQVAM